MTPFIVAEMSASHLGDFDRAVAIVDAAADAGADGIKLQTWTPGTMCVSDYRLDHGPWKGRLLRELYAEAWTPWEWHAKLFDHARRRGLIPFSAAFDRESVDFLETLGVDRHKVASFELTDLPLIRYMASKGKPMILSTGMARADEIRAAVETVWEGRPNKVRDPRITILRCLSSYPADTTDMSVRGLVYGGGLSDHSLGIGMAVAAAAVGAGMIEKHLTLSRSDGGPDAGFSMEPAEFAQMVTECRRVAGANVRRHRVIRAGSELRRSLWVSRDMSAGDFPVLGYNVVTARPALGLSPSTYLGDKCATRDLRAGEPLTQECIS